MTDRQISSFHHPCPCDQAVRPTHFPDASPQRQSWLCGWQPPWPDAARRLQTLGPVTRYHEPVEMQVSGRRATPDTVECSRRTRARECVCVCVCGLERARDRKPPKDVMPLAGVIMATLYGLKQSVAARPPPPRAEGSAVRTVTITSRHLDIPFVIQRNSRRLLMRTALVEVLFRHTRTAYSMDRVESRHEARGSAVEARTDEAHRGKGHGEHCCDK